MTLLARHFERIKRRLRAEGDAARSFQHGLNRGQIREAFIREFLAQNISDLWGVGTGEIIHEKASPEEARPQLDVVVHNKKFPKLSLATGIDLFFIETVSSFIEIKSCLTKDDVRKAAAATKRVKRFATFPPQRLNPVGLVKAPRPYSFVFAYEGPKKMETVLGWLKTIGREDEYGLDSLKATEPNKRFFFDHSFIDGVFVLGRGFVVLDALPFQSHIDRGIMKGLPIPPESVWVYGKGYELLMLWALINQINACLLWNEADLNPYIGPVPLLIDDSP
ncbi:MAG: hypothetical protein OXI56_00025 [bacterium]|nr:hypothetical protein [bacterium]MDE0600163.1 hypothetical protein [bacterium]